MSIWGKIAGGAAGLAFGGPIGALMGAFAGHLVLDRKGGEGAPESQVAFTVGVIALGAKMAKADGVVTSDEVRAFKEVFEVPEAQAKHVAKVFNLAKQDVAGYESYAKQLANMFGKNPELLTDILDGLFHIAKADGVVHPKEMEFLKGVGNIFGLTHADFRQVQARHMGPGEGDPYAVLKVSPEASNDEIKSHYRKLIVENHPDKVIARGVPEEFVSIANERIAAINAAYDRIRKEREF